MKYIKVREPNGLEYGVVVEDKFLSPQEAISYIHEKDSSIELANDEFITKNECDELFYKLIETLANE